MQAFLISLKAGGVGLNLTQADYVFIIDPWWNPAAESQAIARAHRIGQDKQVIAYRFITQNSICLLYTSNCDFLSRYSLQLQA